MGAVQKLATVVIVGLVGLATLLVVYLANEPHRRSTDAKTQQEVSIERGVDLFVQYCVACHAANGGGLMNGDGHIGAPLGGFAYGIDLNQKGVNEAGTPWPGGVSGRADYLYNAIYYGKNCDASGNNCQMPDWGKSGQLNEEQINDLVTMIQHVDWNYVYNRAIEANGGKWPTQTGLSSSAATPAATQAPSPSGQASSGGGKTIDVDMQDIKFVPTKLSIPANTPVTVNLKNSGNLPHNFSIDKLNIHQTLDPGKSTTFTINAPAGTYQYYCDEPGHKAAGMVGTLTVSANGGAAATGGGQGGQAAAQPTQAAQQPASTAAAGGAASGGGATSVTVDMQDIKFVPNTLSIPANTPVKVTLKNTGALPHNFSIDKLNIHETLQPGKTTTFTIKAPAGTYQYYCNEPGHKAAGMVGTLTVK